MATPKNTTLIRFPRCKFIAESRQIALLHLMEDVTHVVGQPVMISYYKNSQKTEIDTIVAIGIGNGKGKNCFKVITTGQFILIWDIVYSLPDVSSLVHGEVYLYNDRTAKIWYMVYSNEGVYRKIEPITEEPKFYIRLTDNSLWVSGSDLIVKPLADFYSKTEIDAIVSQIKIDTDFSQIEEKLNEAIEKSNSAIDKTVELEERIEHIEDGTTATREIATVHNYIKSVNLVNIYGEPSNKTWFSKRDIRSFEAGSLEFEITYHKFTGEDLTSGFDTVKMAIGDEPFIEVTPNENGYYTNPSSIILTEGEDLDIPVTFAVTVNDIEKLGEIDLHGLSESRYFGRIDDPEQINLPDLTEDNKYAWGNLKHRENLEISGEGTLSYFVCIYPSSWGDLEYIRSNNLIYYTKKRDSLGKSTFTRKEIIIDDINFVMYIYRTVNGEEAIDINLI